jgi:hypothetical protein
MAGSELFRVRRCTGTVVVGEFVLDRALVMMILILPGRWNRARKTPRVSADLGASSWRGFSREQAPGSGTHKKTPAARERSESSCGWT